MVLQGHRSIVNQVRYNSRYSVIASSGVEKMVKVKGTSMRLHLGVTFRLTSYVIPNAILIIRCSQTQLWSPFPLPNSKEGRSTFQLQSDSERRIFSHGDYINLVMQSGQVRQLQLQWKFSAVSPCFIANIPLLKTDHCSSCFTVSLSHV